MQTTTESVLQEVSKSRHSMVKLGFTDIDGILRGKRIHKDKFFSALKDNFGFCSLAFGWDAADKCYDNVDVCGTQTGFPDIKAKLDIKTFRKVPWENDLPFFLAEFVDEEGKEYPLCPRQLLKKMIRRAKYEGFQASCGMEFEWFTFKETAQSLHDSKYADPKPMTPGMFGYSLLRPSLYNEYFTAIIEDLAAFGVPLEGVHTETGPGVLEAAILYSDALEAADRATLFKASVKEIAHRFDMTASFMAKWKTDLPGCSGHIHQSLWDQTGEHNQFFDENDPNVMSETFKYYVAGQLILLPEILPFFLPNVNSYKRLDEEFWASTHATWGVDNRIAPLRVLPSSMHSTRLETRLAGSDTNPYLAIAACLGAGLYGIKNKIKLPKQMQGNKKQTADIFLAQNLYAATEQLNNSTMAREIFGGNFVDHFVKTRDWEWREFQKSVTDFERKRYFEII